VARQPPLWTAYAIIGAALWAAGRWRDGLNLRLAFAIPLVDIPMVFALQLLLVPGNPDITSLSAFAVATFVFVVLLASTIFSTTLIVTTSISGTVASLILLTLTESDLGGHAVATLLLTGSAFVAVSSGARLMRLMRSITDEQARGAELRALSTAKDRFVATVSHDFRAPLAAVLTNLQTVRNDPNMPPETARRFLGRAERLCQRLGALVTDLLDLARIEGRTALCRPQDLGALLTKVVDEHRATAESRHIDLRASARPEEVPLRAPRAGTAG